MLLVRVVGFSIPYTNSSTELLDAEKVDSGLLCFCFLNFPAHTVFTNIPVFLYFLILDFYVSLFF
jgi:hypothetical protein